MAALGRAAARRAQAPLWLWAGRWLGVRVKVGRWVPVLTTSAGCSGHLAAVPARGL